MMNSSIIRGLRDIISLAMIQRTKSLRIIQKEITYSKTTGTFSLMEKPNMSQQNAGIAIHRRKLKYWELFMWYLGWVNQFTTLSCKNLVWGSKSVMKVTQNTHSKKSESLLCLCMVGMQQIFQMDKHVNGEHKNKMIYKSWKRPVYKTSGS